ncbi:Protoporphyrinogen oxidase [Nadsonia fulvescens var. elongata DSM 6958]|uniref:protoporphyrinogen oxidase n=1 Tax=Nadsonia fulvescens var. elongata DSM 6958 TaxID=857566 RepID=A0A1E3PSF4_9ASCO|nr:Protoporphyrinogen oxidase [Nadsonia fulvescens var. elongata DSM 6958]
MSGISRFSSPCSARSGFKPSSMRLNHLKSLRFSRTNQIAQIAPALFVALPCQTRTLYSYNRTQSVLWNHRNFKKLPGIYLPRLYSTEPQHSDEFADRTLKLSLPETFSAVVPQYTPYGHKTPQPWTSLTNVVRNIDYFTTRYFGKRHSEEALSAMIRDVESYKESKDLTGKLHPDGEESHGFQQLDRKHQMGEYFSNEFITGSVDALAQLITAVREKNKSQLVQMCTEELYMHLDKQLDDFDNSLIKSISVIPDATRSMIREVYTYSGSQPVCEHFMHNAYTNEKEEGLLRFGNYFVESKAKDELPEGAQFVIDVEVDAKLEVELNDGSTGVIEKTFVISFQSPYLPRERDNLANDNLSLISIVDYSIEDFDWTISNINYTVKTLVEHDEPTPENFTYNDRIEWEGRSRHPPSVSEGIQQRINKISESTDAGTATPVQAMMKELPKMNPYFGISTQQREIINQGLVRPANSLPDLPESSTVVILGGGISGLTSAFFLSETRPDLKIRVLESENRFGGWIESKPIETTNGTTVFEKGPRTLKYNVGADILLNKAIEFNPDLRVAKIRSLDPVNVPRVLFNGNLQLVPSPALGLIGILKFLISPLGISILPEALGRYINRSKYARPEGVMDETMKQFFDRRVGPCGSSAVGSALAHGIYAGDYAQISASATFGAKYDMERIMGKKAKYLSMHDALLAYIFAKGEPQVMNAKLTHGGTAMYVLPDGLESIIKAYVDELKTRSNVSLESGSKVSSLAMSESRDSCLVSVLGQDKPIEAQLVHSTLTTQRLAPLLAKPMRSVVDVIPTTTLMVINIYIPERDVTGIKGFGYLVPKVSAADNNDSILGVIFDSDVNDAAELISGRKVISNRADKAGTKITVMMGGHYWAGISQYPSQEEAIARANRAVYKHMGINLSDYQCTFDAKLQRDSIPQPFSGHYETTEDIKELLYEAYNGRLSMDGGMALGGGVGISECIVDSYLLGASYNSKVPQAEVKNLKNMRYNTRLFSYPVEWKK